MQNVYTVKGCFVYMLVKSLLPINFTHCASSPTAPSPSLSYLQPSHSESLPSRLLRDQRERRPGEGLRDLEREDEGSRRRSALCSSSLSIGERAAASSCCSSTLTPAPLALGLRLHCRLRGAHPWPSLSSLAARLWWRVRREGRGLGERDHDSVSEDGGRTVSVGMAMGWLPRPGDVIVIFKAWPQRSASHLPAQLCVSSAQQQLGLHHQGLTVTISHTNHCNYGISQSFSS